MGSNPDELAGIRPRGEEAGQAPPTVAHGDEADKNEPGDTEAGSDFGGGDNSSRKLHVGDDGGTWPPPGRLGVGPPLLPMIRLWSEPM